MSDELDPEVIADLRLRASTERDTSRAKEAPTWTPAKIFGQWCCRTPGCGAMVDVTEDCFERWSIFNRELRRRGEDPLDPKLIVYCDRCEGLFRAASADKRRKEVDRMAEVIRQLKDGAETLDVTWNGQRHTLSKTEAYEKLQKWGHPDAHGLKQAIEEKASSGKRTKIRGM